MAKTSLGLDENIEGALCYLLAWVSGIVFIILEKDNKFVRFHAMQSILVFLPLMILAWIFGGFFGAFACLGRVVVSLVDWYANMAAHLYFMACSHVESISGRKIQIASSWRYC